MGDDRGTPDTKQAPNEQGAEKERPSRRTPLDKEQRAFRADRQPRTQLRSSASSQRIADVKKKQKDDRGTPDTKQAPNEQGAEKERPSRRTPLDKSKEPFVPTGSIHGSSPFGAWRQSLRR